MKEKLSAILVLLFCISFIFVGCSKNTSPSSSAKETSLESSADVSGEKKEEPFSLPEYTGAAYVSVNSLPSFSDSEKTNTSYEKYGDLDKLGRCTAAVACIGKDLMPTEPRGEIGQIKPTGWKTVKYDCVDGKYLYNRCHLIGFQLTGENANEKNLITGTRYLNVEGMLPFENMVADYIKETGNHVLYKVTPVFVGDELVARGVTMEALSVEDGGEGINFNVYCFNVQPGIVINYSDGTSYAEETPDKPTDGKAEADYVLNTGSKKFHRPSCDSVKSISEKNKKDYHGKREDLINNGYSPCKSCNP